MIAGWVPWSERSQGHATRRYGVSMLAMQILFVFLPWWALGRGWDFWEIRERDCSEDTILVLAGGTASQAKKLREVGILCGFFVLLGLAAAMPSVLRGTFWTTSFGSGGAGPITLIGVTAIMAWMGGTSLFGSLVSHRVMLRVRLNRAAVLNALNSTVRGRSPLVSSSGIELCWITTDRRFEEAACPTCLFRWKRLRVSTTTRSDGIWFDSRVEPVDEISEEAESDPSESRNLVISARFLGRFPVRIADDSDSS